VLLILLNKTLIKKLINLNDNSIINKLKYDKNKTELNYKY